MDNNFSYQVTELGSNVWGIQDGMVNFFLVAGTQKALLIDSGWGINNLANFVKTLTPLPIMLVQTHGHVDHVSGDFHFSEAYISSDDIPSAKNAFMPDMRGRMLGRFPKETLPKDFSAEQWLQANFENFIKLDDKPIDLGGRSVEIIPIPGHTAGSVCFIDSLTGFAFTGDSVIENFVLLHMDQSLSVATYYQSLQKLIAKQGSIKSIMPCHGVPPLSPSILNELSLLAQKIIDGKEVGILHETYLGSGLLCKSGKTGILYRENNIH